MVRKIQNWEQKDSIKVLKREIEILKARKKRLEKKGWEIDYNTTQGQRRSEQLEKELNIIDDELGRLKHLDNVEVE